MSARKALRGTGPVVRNSQRRVRSTRRTAHGEKGCAVAMLLAAILLAFAIVGVKPADAAPADWDDGDNTGTAYSLCAWIGVRDGVLGVPGTTLVGYYNFDYFGDAWVHCIVRVQAPTFVACWHYIIDRDRAHLYSGTYHLSPTVPPCTV